MYKWKRRLKRAFYFLMLHNNTLSNALNVPTTHPFDRLPFSTWLQFPSKGMFLISCLLFTGLTTLSLKLWSEKQGMCAFPWHLRYWLHYDEQLSPKTIIPQLFCFKRFLHPWSYLLLTWNKRVNLFRNFKWHKKWLITVPCDSLSHDTAMILAMDSSQGSDRSWRP